ncbi:MAG: methionine--tRNA ligase [Patescibacteria group bacterium]|nr:methionine--tRNA ligase [Patescibacteria group bacterium]
MLKPTIPFSVFSKLDLRIGKIIKAEEKEGSEKLVRLTVDLGEEVGQRTIFAGLRPPRQATARKAGIKSSYPTKSLVGKLIVVLVNLEPKKMLDEESRGMLLAADVNGRPILLKPEKKVEPGTIIR